MPAMYRSVVPTISFFCLVCFGRGQTPCTPGQSNYTISKYSTDFEVANHTYEIRLSYGANCNVWEKIKSWFRTDRCDTKYVLKKVTRTINQTKTVKHEITQCCPGYKNETDICTESCVQGKFGENCEQNCSCSFKHLYCDSNGQCLCPAGATGDNCTLVCKNGTFGMNCSEKCMCNNNSTCDVMNGSCDCTDPGWEGETCDKECRNGTFGYNCKQTCICNENQTCSHVDGLCTCKAGWKGNNCSEECEDFKFGVDCKEDCLCNRNNTESCDRKTGDCFCRPGYIDLNCNQECPFGLYGEGCNYNCSNHCTGTDYCDFINGSCICLGKQGTNCTDECDQGKYGPDCEWECNCNYTNSNGSCDAYTGSCHCAAGWEGRICTAVCQNGKFGHNCNESCTCNENQDCHHVDGSCTCKRGWKGVTCSQECGDFTFGMNCLESCACNPNNTNSCNPQTGQCYCLPGYIGINCTDGAALRAKSSPDQKQHLTYGLAGAGGLLAVVVIVVVAVVHRRNKMNSLRDSLESTGKENRTYCKDGADFTETMCNEEKEIKGNSYEDTFIDADHTNNGEKTDTNPESSKKPLFKEHIDDSKDLVAKTDSQVIYDTAEETTTTTKESANAYNTFNDIRKLDKDQQKDTHSQDEEDYDTLVHGSSCKGSIKRVTDDIEDYSSFAIVKQSSIQEEGGEDLYNVLNEDSVKKKHKTAQINDSSYHHIDLKNKTIDGERIPCPVKGEPAMVKANKETVRPAKASFSTKQMSTVEADDQQNVQANVNEKSIKVTKTPPEEINSGPKKTRISVNQNEQQSETLDNLVRDKKVTDIDEVEYEDVIYDECQSEQTQGETAVIPGNNDNSSTKNLDKNGPEMKQASRVSNFNKSSFETISADCLKDKTLITKNDEHRTSVTGIDTMQDTVSASQRSVSAEVAYEEVPEDEEHQILYENVDEDEPGSDSDSGLSDKVGENEELSKDDKRPMNRKLSRRKEDYEEFQL